MPHTSSAKKRLRQNLKRRARNRATKKGVKIQVRKFTDGASAKEVNVDQLKIDLVAAIKKLDKAAARRVIHPNTAARKKSQLARLLNSKTAGGAAPAK